MTTVLVRFGQLGDVVLLGSVTAALGDAVIVCEPRWFPVARRLRGVVDVVAPEQARGLAGRWVDLQGSARSAWLCRGRGAVRIRKHSVARRLWMHTGWPDPPRPSVPELYGRAVGVRPVGPPWIQLSSDVRELLVLLPGASAPLKRWGGFHALASAWNGPIAVLGGPGEHELCEAVAWGVRGAEVVCGAGFDRVFELLARARVAVGNDSGLLHLASACGVPTVAVFGPTHPNDGFARHFSEIVQRDLTCRPCTLHRVDRCRRGDHGCMQIDEGRVLRAVAASSGRDGLEPDHAS